MSHLVTDKKDKKGSEATSVLYSEVLLWGNYHCLNSKTSRFCGVRWEKGRKKWNLGLAIQVSALISPASLVIDSLNALSRPDGKRGTWKTVKSLGK